jgi:general secretion pathway protein C
MHIDSKRISGAISLLLFMALCASLAYWSTQWFRPKQRPVAAPVVLAEQQIDPSMAAGLFGARLPAAPVASNHRLVGVVAAENAADSIAIMSIDGKPARAIRGGATFAPGAFISEIHATYVILTVNGVMQRVDLPRKPP